MNNRYHYIIIKNNKNSVASDFYAPIAFLSLKKIAKYMRQDYLDAIETCSIYKVMIYKDNIFKKSFNFYANEVGDVSHYNY